MHSHTNWSYFKWVATDFWGMQKRVAILPHSLVVLVFNSPGPISHTFCSLPHRPLPSPDDLPLCFTEKPRDRHTKTFQPPNSCLWKHLPFLLLQRKILHLSNVSPLMCSGCCPQPATYRLLHALSWGRHQFLLSAGLFRTLQKNPVNPFLTPRSLWSPFHCSAPFYKKSFPKIHLSFIFHTL